MQIYELVGELPEKSQLPGLQESLGAVVSIELAIQVVNVSSYSALRDEKLCSNFWAF